MKKTIIIIFLLFILNHCAFAQEIFDAIRNGDTAKVMDLVEKEPRLIKAKNFRQSSPLHVAVDVDNEPIARYLIDKGAEINAVNGSQWTPLFYAKKANMARLLVKKGAEINFKGSLFSPLSISVFQKRKEVAEYLLEAGAELPDIKKGEGVVLLREALKCGSIVILDKYLSRGFDPLFENELQDNLLHFASERGSTELIDKLISRGVSVNKTNIFGFNPLHIAAFNGNTEIVTFFVQKGVDMNARTNDGKTPFNFAMEANHQETAEVLKSLGADQSPQRFPVLTGEYMGQPKPGNKAVPFAPGIVSPNSRHTYHSAMALAPNGNEMYWSVYVGEEETTSILCAKKVDGKWTQPEIISKGDVPFISPDGSKFYFIGWKQVQERQREVIYVRNKTASGWSEPYELPDIINSMPGIHWQLSVDQKGNLYFGAQLEGSDASRIYYSEYSDGRYSESKIVESLKDVGAHSPFIAPDGSYMIISKEGEGLNLLFKNKDGSWTPGINLADSLGIAGECSIVTPDGKYLFFLCSVSYWADTSFIEKLR